METIFTKIINREIPADIIYEDDYVLAFNDISPKAPIHVLVIPKTPIPTLNDIQISDAELIGKIIITAKNIAKDLNIDKNGYRLVLNCNENGGQTVFHIHCHLLGGRAMNWPPG